VEVDDSSRFVGKHKLMVMDNFKLQVLFRRKTTVVLTVCIA